METKSKIPALRFKGFTDAWEERRFGDTVTIERGGSPRPISKYITNSEDGLNWIKIGDAPEEGNYITHTAEKILPEGLSKTREVHPGDLILSNSMSFGKPYIMEMKILCFLVQLMECISIQNCLVTLEAHQILAI